MNKRDCKGKIKGGIGWNLRTSGVLRVLSDVPVSRNLYKLCPNYTKN